MAGTVFAILLRIFSNSFLNVIQKRLSSSIPSLNINFYTYFILTIFSLPSLLIFYIGDISFDVLFWALSGGVFGAFGNLFLISALKRGEMSVLGPINSYKAIVGLVFSFILLKEIPNLREFFGILLIIFGSYFIFETQKEGFSFKIFLRQDVQFRLLALIFTGIEAVFIKKVIILSGPFLSFLLWVVFGCLFSFLIMKIFGKKTSGKRHLPDKKGTVLGLVFLSFLVFLMQLSTNYVFQRISVSSALSLFQISNVLNVFLGYKIFKEENLLKKLIGSVIMMIGSVVIIFCGQN